MAVDESERASGHAAGSNERLARDARQACSLTSEEEKAFPCAAITRVSRDKCIQKVANVTEKPGGKRREERERGAKRKEEEERVKKWQKVSESGRKRHAQIT